MARKRSKYTLIWEQPIGDPLGLVALGHKYFDWMQAKNYSPKTITIRRYDLGFFLCWCKEQSIRRAADVTGSTVEKYQGYLCTTISKKTNRPRTPNFRNRLLYSLSYFFRFLVRKCYLLYNPAAQIKYYRQERRLPRAILTPEEVERIINQTDINTDMGIRNRAILETFYSTGIRRYELLRLTICDLDLQRGTLIVIEGKGKKDRVVPIGERACKWIEKYLEQVRTAKKQGQNILFLTMRGKPISAEESLSLLVRKYIRAAGIQKKGACHLLRHSMATQMLENGADIRYIQEILGHADLSTTEIYTRVSIAKLKEVHGKTHPTSQPGQDALDEANYPEPDKKVIRSGSQPGQGAHSHTFWDRDPITPNDLIALGKKFLHWMQSCGTYAPGTIRSVGHYLKHFVLWCHLRQLIIPQQVSKTDVENFQTFVHQKKSRKNAEPLSARTQAYYLHSLYLFFRWLLENNHTFHNPAEALDMPKSPKRLPRHIPTYQQIETLLEQPDLSDPLGVRDRAIMETLYSTGLRRIELAHLTTCDLDPNRSTIIVIRGKGNKDRIVPIGEQALVWIEKYLTQVRPQLILEPDETTIFLTKQGNPISIDALSRLVNKYIKAAGISAKGSCHLLRHAMATHMLENGADIRYIQEILGHTDLSTTEIYTRVSIAKLKEIHTKTHPAKTYPTKTPKILTDLEQKPEN